MGETEQAIVITSCGWVTPLGAGDLRRMCSRYAEHSREFNSQSIEQRIPEAVLQASAEIPLECAKEELVHVAACALQLASKGARIEESPLARERIGMVLGCTLAGIGGMIDFADDVRSQSARFVSPLRFPQTVGNYLCGALARSFSLRGPNLTLATLGPSCGLAALAEAISILDSEGADLVFAGGVNCVPRSLVESTESAAPNSIVGAFLFALEREDCARLRGAEILARVTRERLVDHPAHAEIKSVSGVPQPGAIHVEHWVGSCGAALGAAAVAAGLAALKGLKVPIHDPGAPTETQLARVTPLPAHVSVTGDTNSVLKLLVMTTI